MHPHLLECILTVLINMSITDISDMFHISLWFIYKDTKNFPFLGKLTVIISKDYEISTKFGVFGSIFEFYRTNKLQNG